jgi:hypothetical protein
MLSDYLAASNFRMLKASAQIILQLFQKFALFRFPRAFLRAYLSIIQENLSVVGEIIKIE